MVGGGHEAVHAAGEQGSVPAGVGGRFARAANRADGAGNAPLDWRTYLINHSINMRTATPSARPRGRKAGVPDGDTERRILDAARRVFTRRGTAGTRLREIADEAGVTQALINYYFASKDALAERVFIEAAGVMAAVLRDVPQPGLTLEGYIERFVTGYIAAVRHAPFLPGYVLAEAQQNPARVDQLVSAALGTVPSQVAGRIQAHLGEVVAARVAAGTMRAMPLRQLLVNVIGLAVFPFIAQPLLRNALQLDDAAFNAFLDERSRELPGFIINALRP